MDRAPNPPGRRTGRCRDRLDAFRATVARDPDGDAVRYFGGRITWAELDALTDSFAAGIMAEGFRPGERVALFLQNVPQFVVAQLGTWKAGGVAVSINPMNRERELAELLRDSGSTVLVTLGALHRDVATHVVDTTAVRTVATTSELEYRAHDDPRVFAGSERVECPGTTDLADMLAHFRGHAAPDVAVAADDVAVLTYTSGTTGPPKGAMTTHRNLIVNARTYRDWVGLDATDVVLGVAPLFHVTGLVGHIAVAVLVGAPLVLMYRLDPAATLDIAETERATFTVGSITVYVALMNAPNASREKLASLTKICSGGAPIPPATVAAFREAFGHYVHNIYGLTETTSPSHAVPFGVEAPVDPMSGALSVGVPVYDTVVRVVDERGADLPVGDVGELVVEGPQVVAGYWGKPEETATALPGGALHTGDVGYMDAHGWFYVVDRKKDQINAGGYKVWPREVEDVLHEHPAVREAAVVGVPDEYRGETVKAFVSLRPGASTTREEIIGFAKQRMAAYKYPRLVEILDELPKTASGKILRRELRGT
ncbi:MAG: long-chain fatty acid--CoA ligase [Pseudonocardiaceae bacterium]|nr:MAG: long-chain fatty acid--CoA ligase [Pseudonocardiaceae bacterium]